MNEKQLKRLTKEELLHLLITTVGIEELTVAWKKVRDFQTADKSIPIMPRCWICESIANKLSK